jgi:hypothetical protein
MQFRERRLHDDTGPESNPQASGPDGSNLENVRSAGKHFLAAGNEAIQKALSKGNSEAFLAANRQAGGQ